MSARLGHGATQARFAGTVNVLSENADVFFNVRIGTRAECSQQSVQDLSAIHIGLTCSKSTACSKIAARCSNLHSRNLHGQKCFLLGARNLHR